MISFIVSAFERPMALTGCLASLAIQGQEIHVCDNHPDRMNEMAAEQFGVYYHHSAPYTLHSCYDSSEAALPHTHGEWLCFPSDDSYYVPRFADMMLRAAEQNDWEFVYCDMLYDPRLMQRCFGRDEYSIMQTSAVAGQIDKTCFIVTRRAFDQVGGWPKHADDWRDGALAEALVAAGIKHGHVAQPLVVHN